MISKGDDFPIHQLPAPVAEVGTERNFYDRYFFQDQFQVSNPRGICSNQTASYKLNKIYERNNRIVFY